MRATRSYRGAIPVKTEITARRCRARAVIARAQDRQRGSAWAYVDNVLPCGVRARRGTPPASGTPRYRAPGWMLTPIGQNQFHK